MATIRRDIAPGKEKRGTISPHTRTTTQPKGGPNYPSKTNSRPQNHTTTTSQKNIASYLKVTKTSNLDVSDQHNKKPASTNVRSSDKTPTPAQKTRISTNPPLRSSSLLGKTGAPQKPVPTRNLKEPAKNAAQILVPSRNLKEPTKKAPQKLVPSRNLKEPTKNAPQKLVPGRNLKEPTKHPEKHRFSSVRPVSTIKKSIADTKKQETEINTFVTKEEIISSPHDKDENPSTFVVPEPERQSEDQECYISEDVEQTVQVSNNEKSVDDLVPEDQEPLDTEQTESDGGDKGDKIVIPEYSTVLEQQDAPLGIQTEGPEDKSCIEETSSKQQESEQHGTTEVSLSNTEESVGDHPKEEAKEEEVEEKEVVEEEKGEERGLNKKEDAPSGSEAHETKVIEVQEVVEQKKKEVENVAPKPHGAQGKKDSALSNDVIEETASKLREQRKNKVKALAGAFETVISLQERK